MDFNTVVKRCKQLHVSPSEESESAGQERELCAGEIYGRICSSINANPPIKLSTTATRKTVFIFGPDAVESIILKMNTYDALLHLGFNPPYIYYEVVERKYTTWLVLFKSSAFSDERGSLILPATWDGVEEIIRMLYPEAYTDFRQHLPELKEKDFEYFEKQAGFSFLQARKNEDNIYPNAPPFYSYDYFCSLAKPRSSWQVRVFLYCELRLLELFRGDGSTTHPDGNRTGPKEYLCPNATIAEVNPMEIAVLPLTVIIPSQQIT